VSENLGSWSFLQVGACKSGGFNLLPIGARELKELVLPSGWCLLPVGAIEFGNWCLLPVGAIEFGNWCFL